MQPAQPLPAVEHAERSDPGRDPDKQVNEDACAHLSTRFGRLSVVCDGMGGHAGGREASELALRTILEAFDRAPDASLPPVVLRGAIEEACRRVYALGGVEHALGRPGSTVVAVLLHALGTEVAHVGDSRAYHVHEGRIARLTRDHSVVQELVDRGLLTPQQAAHHPEANRITRALGMTPEVEVEVRPQPVLHVTGDAFVLCSDGLSDLVEDPEILAIVGSEPAAQAVGKLVDLANARGGHDNVTVAVLRARESATGAHGPALAQTVAQTDVTQAETSLDIGRATLLERPLQTASVASPVAARLEPASTNSASIVTRPPRRPTPTVLLALALAGSAAALLVGVLFSELSERGGKRNAPSATILAVEMDASIDGPTTLVPEAPPAATNAPGTPIAPLDPSPAPSSSVRRRR